MARSRSKRSIKFYQALPKVELHRHLEGSVRVSTLVEIGKNHNIHKQEASTLGPLVQIREDDPYTFENFLSKFVTLRLFYRSPEVIGRITREAIEDAANDNIRYLELRFTPVALSKAEGFPLEEVIDWVIEGTKEGEDAFGVKTRLITSINRHESPELAEQVTQISIERKGEGIVGLDLAGNEAEFPAEPFMGFLLEAHQEGLNITIHAGEWGGAANVAEAIKHFETTRIGHGVRIMEDADVVALARETGTVFEVCITSNYQSGVVPAVSQHPLPHMLASGLNATLNTDDPSVSQITLSQEYLLACEKLELSLSELRERILAAAQAAFLSTDEKKQLVEEIKRELNQKIPPS